MSIAAGTLDWKLLVRHPGLAAQAVTTLAHFVPTARIAEIDPRLADTAAFCKAYGVAPEKSANCVIVAGRRGEATRYAAVIVLATMRADVNGVIRKELDARKCSFAPMDDVLALTGMEVGGITPIGLPEDWPILVDDAVIEAGEVIVGSGLRRSKILLHAGELLTLPVARSLRLAI